MEGLAPGVAQLPAGMQFPLTISFIDFLAISPSTAYSGSLNVAACRRCTRRVRHGPRVPRDPAEPQVAVLRGGLGRLRQAAAPRSSPVTTRTCSRATRAPSAAT
ncbi:hypothetical protein E4K10_20675 [Streptomyces sp. T1317-0309]|nr:hypothetical protein E4K10_20675 [Streptomyces sp. T1317-0309]